MPGHQCEDDLVDSSVDVTIAHDAAGVREEHAREIGRDTLELWVINDNERAIRVYERSGWLGTDEVQRDAGRLERRFLKRVRQAATSDSRVPNRSGFEKR
jgi:hypothetical protein